MVRCGLMLLSAVPALLVSCAPMPAARMRFNTDREARAQIEQLVARYPPLYAEGTLLGPVGAPPSDAGRDADEERVKAAYERLRSMGIAAFPALVAASNDGRYSFSRVVAAIDNASVGDACFEIIESQVDFYGCGYKSRHGANGSDWAKPQYLWEVRADGKLGEWWAARRDRSLAELQTEALRWTIAHEEAIGFASEAQRTQVLGPLLARVKVLGASDAAPHTPTARTAMESIR